MDLFKSVLSCLGWFDDGEAFEEWSRGSVDHAGVVASFASSWMAM